MNRAGGRRDETTSATFPRVLGRYHLLEELSENAVGVLHLARLEGPKGFQRWSAVRRMHPHLAGDSAFVRDFYDAARAAASIQHPNVEATLDVGDTEGTHWVALEYLHGERVSHLVSRAEIAETGVAWDVACRIVAQASLGLDSIHESQERRGPPFDLNHARLTPRQIFVSYEGETKILEACVPRRAAATLSSDVLSYLSPEQLYGDATDRRSDVFALGIILWEMCAGRRLFLGDDDDATRQLLDRHDVPRLETKVRGLPRKVDEIIALALATEPRHRYGTAIDLAHAIDEALVSESLVVTDYDAGRYMKALFADRFAAREERLRRAADATEIFTRASLQQAFAPQPQQPPKPKPRASIPPPSLPPQRSALRSTPPIPIPPPTSRDVHEVETVVGIPTSEPYAADLAPLSDSNEVYTAVMGEEERAALIAEADPNHARTDENEVATAPQISGLDYDEDEENEPTIAHPPAGDLTVSYPAPGVELNPDATIPIPSRRPKPRVDDYEERRPPRTERMDPQRNQQRPQRDPREQMPASTTNVGPAPVMDSRPPPPLVTQSARRDLQSERPRQGSYDLERPPSVEINATPPPMNAIDAQHAVSDGYLRIPAQQFPGASSYPPPPQHQPIPPTAQTYMISPKAPHELSTAAWLFALAIAVGGIAVIYESWSHSQNATASPADSVTPATATIPTANATTPTTAPTTATVNPQDLPLSQTGFVPQNPSPHGGRNIGRTTPTRGGGRGSGKAVAPQPPPQQPADPQPPPVAGGSGFLTVICTPACDDVVDGNSSLGPSPVFKAQVRAGTHQITLKVSDPPSTKVVSAVVPADDTKVVKVSMDGS
jgi:serine/threonine-protein kinase